MVTASGVAAAAPCWAERRRCRTQLVSGGSACRCRRASVASVAAFLCPPLGNLFCLVHTSLPVMVLESTIVCVDNSEWMRNGDFPPSRLVRFTGLPLFLMVLI